MSGNKVMSSYIWSLAEKMLIQLVTFAVGIILARKVGPKTYGVVGIVTTITSFFNLITSLHTGTFLMRKKEVDSLDMNTAFFFNILVSVFVSVLIFFLAPVFADFYNNQDIIKLLRISCINIIIAPFMGIKMVTIVRKYQYKLFFFISLLGTIIAGIVGVKLAFMGYGPLALLLHSCVDAFIDTIFLWIFDDWKPRIEFSFQKLKEMLSYGIALWASGIFDFLTLKLQTLIIGKKYSTSDLAAYNRGESLPSTIETYTTSSLNDVLLKRASEEQEDPVSLAKLLNKTNKICLHISFSTMLGLFAISNSLVFFLLGTEWMISVPFLKIFCIAFALKPIEVTSDIVLKAAGKSKEYFILGVIKKICFFLLMVCSVPFGPFAIAVSYLIATILATIISMLANKKIFCLKLYSQLKNLVKVLSIAISMCIIVILVGVLIENIPVIIRIIIQILCGATLYMIIMHFLDKDAFDYLKNFVRLLFRRGDKE